MLQKRITSNSKKIPIEREKKQQRMEEEKILHKLTQSRRKRFLRISQSFGVRLSREAFFCHDRDEIRRDGR